MFINLKKLGSVLLLIFIITTSVFGEVNLDTVRKNIRKALLATDFYGEYTVTNFRFGRRQEETFRIWSKDKTLVRQVISPIWQRGEVIIAAEKNYMYYIPVQNACLKMISASPKNWFQELGVSLDKVTQIEGNTTILNREALLLSGENKKRKYKLWISKDNNFPLKIEIYNGDLLFRSLRFHQLEKFPSDFDPGGLIPAKVTHYNDETTFWQMVSIPRLQQGVNFRILQPSYLPDGFILKKATLEELSIATVVHLVYENSQGQVISIFEREKLSAQQKFHLKNLKKIPGPNGVSIYAYQWFKGQVQLALLGPVSKIELKKIAASVK